MRRIHYAQSSLANMTSLRIATLATACALAGCQALLGIEDTTLGNGDSGVDGGPGPGEFSLQVGQAGRLIRNSSVQVEVSLTRGAEFEDEVTISATSLPNGVTVAVDLTFAPGSDSGSLQLNGAIDAALGAATIAVTGTVGSRDESENLEILVADPPGTPDETFASDGVWIDGTTGTAFVAVGVALDSMGRVHLALDAPGAGTVVRVARLDAVGNPSLSASLALDEVQGIAIDSSDRILVIGRSASDSIVQRLSPDLSPDMPFGGGDSVAGLHDDGMGYELATTSGFIYAVGREAQGDAMLYRLLDTGVLDTNFNATGKVAIAELHGERNLSLALDDQGGIIVLGDGTGSPIEMVVTRFLDTAVRDTNFGSGGLITTSSGGTDDASADLAVQSTNRIYLAGRLDDTNPAYTLAPISGEILGTVTSGEVVTGVASTMTAVTFDANGDPVGVGATLQTAVTSAVMRFTASGALDTSFGDAGLSRVGSNGVPDDGVELRDVVVLPNGRIIAVGKTGLSNQRAYVIQLWD